jgi:hypothetical protein
MRVTRPSRAAIAAFACVVLTPAAAVAQEPVTSATGSSHAWVGGWTGSAQCIYPVGYSVGQPEPIGPAGPGNTAPLLREDPPYVRSPTLTSGWPPHTVHPDSVNDVHDLSVMTAWCAAA